jgi:hypothetical protein
LGPNGIHTIQSNNDLYPYKRELKQRINLLKFILRFQNFYEVEQNVHDHKVIINKPITSTSTVRELNSKLNLVNYKNLQDTYESPGKTPQENGNTTRYSSYEGKSLIFNSEDDISVVSSDKVQDVPMEVTSSNEGESVSGSEVHSSQDEEINSGTEESTCADVEDDVGQVLPPKKDEDEDEEKTEQQEIDTENEFVIKSFFTNIISKLYSFFENNKLNSKDAIENGIQEELPKLLGQEHELLLQQLQQQQLQQLQQQQLQQQQLQEELRQQQLQEQLRQQEELRQLQEQLRQQEEQLRQEIQNEIEYGKQVNPIVSQKSTQQPGGLVNWFVNIFYTNKRVVPVGDITQEDLQRHITSEDPLKKPKGGEEYGGSRKKYKKTKKFTRRKNKKSPKRKTIKKRKMPKRNAKTRRQRK